MPERRAEVRIRAATVDDIEALLPLFDAYRVFTAVAPDVPAVREFVNARIARSDATIRVAEAVRGELAGFVTLHQMFALVQLGPQFILEDLFVRETMRGVGVATALLGDARAFAEERGAVGIVLSTHHTNDVAQRLYARCGYVRDGDFFHYALPLDAARTAGTGE